MIDKDLANVDLLSCAHCGENATHVTESITDRDGCSREFYIIECNGCGMRSPICLSKNKAVSTWNCRVSIFAEPKKMEFAFIDN